MRCRKEALFCDLFPEERILMFVGAVGFIHQFAVTNSMRLQSTYTPHLQYLQLEVHLESSQVYAVELFCRSSQRVKAVDYFGRRPPRCIFNWMFDRTLNETLPNIMVRRKSEEELSTT